MPLRYWRDQRQAPLDGWGVWRYLAGVIDPFARDGVGWAVGARPRQSSGKASRSRRRPRATATIGAVSETTQAIGLCREAGERYVISHRFGETKDAFMADFAVAMGPPNQDRLRLPQRAHRQVQPAVADPKGNGSRRRVQIAAPLDHWARPRKRSLTPLRKPRAGAPTVRTVERTSGLNGLSRAYHHRSSAISI
ncbi:protein of unknown function (plasmid) [Methylocella tundrae]|uniref:Enolase n=1 Tax=Methylocella tundrae TaxID=227605 RepID=A0A4U8Z7B5_METTU|nr:protein of unknown function [Methylocella tundrae]